MGRSSRVAREQKRSCSVAASRLAWSLAKVAMENSWRGADLNRRPRAYESINGDDPAGLPTHPKPSSTIGNREPSCRELSWAVRCLYVSLASVDSAARATAARSSSSTPTTPAPPSRSTSSSTSSPARATASWPTSPTPTSPTAPRRCPASPCRSTTPPSTPGSRCARCSTSTTRGHLLRQPLPLRRPRAARRARAARCRRPRDRGPQRPAPARPEYVEEHGLNAYVREEVDPSIQVLRDEGFAVEAFAYPFGAGTDELDRAIAKRVPVLRSIAFTYAIVGDRCPH